MFSPGRRGNHVLGNSARVVERFPQNERRIAAPRRRRPASRKCGLLYNIMDITLRERQLLDRRELRDCRSGLRVRACRLLRGDGSSLETVLAPGRLLELKHRQGAHAVLGFLEELGFGRWLSFHRRRDGGVVDSAVPRPSDVPIPSLPTEKGARTAVSTESSQGEGQSRRYHGSFRGRVEQTR